MMLETHAVTTTSQNNLHPSSGLSSTQMGSGV